MKQIQFLRAAACGIAVSVLAFPASGVVITISPFETPDCDLLVIPNVVHELGTPPFPPDELIECVFTFTNISACPLMDDPLMPNILMVITNLTPTFWTDLHYVADAGPNGPETSLSNDDGLITGGLAFKIDTVGVNTPLVFESILADLIFAPGETWHFIIQDYSNTLGLPPSAMSSIGVGTGSAGDPFSSGSIVAIPGPGSLALLAIGGLFVRPRRRR